MTGWQRRLLKMAKSKSPVKLVSYEEIMGIADCEEVVMIAIDDITPFKNHPFKVRDDEKMQELIKSINLQGILTPVTVRADDNRQYEMISGHRRMHAASMLGMETIPAIIKEMDDDEATIAMVNANIQREEQLPSEKAFSYKMMLEAMKRKAGRPSKNNACQSGTNLRSDELMALDVGESARSIQRCIRLTELIAELLDMVDEKKLGFTIAVDISYLEQEVQKWLYEYIRENGVVKPEQIAGLRKYLEKNTVNQMQMIQVLNANLKGRIPSKKVTISEKKLHKYFPAHYTASEMESVIMALLQEWKQRQAGE